MEALPLNLKKEIVMVKYGLALQAIILQVQVFGNGKLVSQKKM